MLRKFVFALLILLKLFSCERVRKMVLKVVQQRVEELKELLAEDDFKKLNLSSDKKHYRIYSTVDVFFNNEAFTGVYKLEPKADPSMESHGSVLLINQENKDNDPEYKICIILNYENVVYEKDVREEKFKCFKLLSYRKTLYSPAYDISIPDFNGFYKTFIADNDGKAVTSPDNTIVYKDGSHTISFMTNSWTGTDMETYIDKVEKNDYWQENKELPVPRKHEDGTNKFIVLHVYTQYFEPGSRKLEQATNDCLVSSEKSKDEPQKQLIV